MSRKLILGIDTSGAHAGVALTDAEGGLLGQRRIAEAQGHCSGLLPAIEELLREKGFVPRDIRAIGVASGPGSFTGLRVGIGTVKGLAMGLRLSCFPIPTMEALAEPYRGREERLAVILPSRRGYVFASVLRMKEMEGFFRPEREMPESNLPEEVFLSSIESPLLVIGPGICRIRKDLEMGAVPGVRMDLDSERADGALGVARLAGERFRAGEGTAPEELLPLYVHHDVAAPPPGS